MAFLGFGPAAPKRVTQPAQARATLVNTPGFHEYSLHFQDNWARRLYGRRMVAFKAWAPLNATGFGPGRVTSGPTWYQGNQPRNSSIYPAVPIRYAVRPVMYPLSTRESFIGMRPTAVTRGLALQAALHAMMQGIYNQGQNTGG